MLSEGHCYENENTRKHYLQNTFLNVLQLNEDTWKIYKKRLEITNKKANNPMKR